MKKKLFGIITALVMMTGVSAPWMAEESHAASVSWSQSSWSVSETNAVLEVKAQASAASKWTAASGTLFAANGSIINSVSETCSHSSPFMKVKYDIKSEMKTALKPGTQYYIQYTATCNGTTYTSPKYGFVTTKKGSVSSFLNDSRWKNGTGWGDGQKPKLSSYSSTGCCAYCADYAKYVYGKSSPRAGKRYTSASSIKANDVLHVNGHWMVVLARNGNSLKIAEGNCIVNRKAVVRVSSDTWTIKGNTIKNKWESNARKFIEGYHY